MLVERHAQYMGAQSVRDRAQPPQSQFHELTSTASPRHCETQSRRRAVRRGWASAGLSNSIAAAIAASTPTDAGTAVRGNAAGVTTHAVTPSSQWTRPWGRKPQRLLHRHPFRQDPVRPRLRAPGGVRPRRSRSRPTCSRRCRVEHAGPPGRGDRRLRVRDPGEAVVDDRLGLDHDHVEQLGVGGDVGGSDLIPADVNKEHSEQAEDCWFVAAAATWPALLLRLAGGPERELGGWASRPTT